MSENLPNLHWIEGRASNVYSWVGEESLTLFDTVMRGDADRILDYSAGEAMLLDKALA